MTTPAKINQYPVNNGRYLREDDSSFNMADAMADFMNDSAATYAYRTLTLSDLPTEGLTAVIGDGTLTNTLEYTANAAEYPGANTPVQIGADVAETQANLLTAFAGISEGKSAVTLSRSEAVVTIRDNVLGSTGNVTLTAPVGVGTAGDLVSGKNAVSLRTLNESIDALVAVLTAT